METIFWAVKTCQQRQTVYTCACLHACGCVFEHGLHTVYKKHAYLHLCFLTDVSCLYGFTAEVQMFPAVWAVPYQCVRVWLCMSWCKCGFLFPDMLNLCLVLALLWHTQTQKRRLAHCNAAAAEGQTALTAPELRPPVSTTNETLSLIKAISAHTHPHTHYLSRQTGGWWHHQLPLQEWKINK